MSKKKLPVSKRLIKEVEEEVIEDNKISNIRRRCNLRKAVEMMKKMMMKRRNSRDLVNNMLMRKVSFMKLSTSKESKMLDMVKEVAIMVDLEETEEEVTIEEEGTTSTEAEQLTMYRRQAVSQKESKAVSTVAEVN